MAGHNDVENDAENSCIGPGSGVHRVHLPQHRGKAWVSRSFLLKDSAMTRREVFVCLFVTATITAAFPAVPPSPSLKSRRSKEWP